MDDWPNPRKVKAWSWLATGVFAVVALTADYGPHPHILSGFQNKMKEFRTWLFKPSDVELNELQKRYRMQLDEGRIEAAAKGKKSPGED